MVEQEKKIDLDFWSSRLFTRVIIGLLPCRTLEEDCGFSSFQVCLMRKRIGIGFPRNFETAPEILFFSYAIFRGRERPEVVLKTGCPDQVSPRFLLKSGNRFGKWGGEARLSDRLPILIQAYLAGWCLLPETGSRAKTSRKLSTEPVCFMHNIHCRTPAW